MSRFHEVALEPFANARGITNEHSVQLGSLSLGGASLPDEAFPSRSEVFQFDRIPFRFVRSQDMDHIEFSGQTLAVSATKVMACHAIGVSTNGDFRETLRFQRDGAADHCHAISFSDFAAAQAAFDDRCVLTLPYLHNRRGRYASIQPRVWYCRLGFDQPISFDRISIPDNLCMHMFALTLEYED